MTPELLAIAKQQCRVDFSTDDAFIALCMDRAIDLLQRKWGFVVTDPPPPAALDIILRVASTLYEFRESVDVSLAQVPQWLDDEMVGLWVPRC